MAEVFKVRNDSGSDLELKTFGVVIPDGDVIELGNVDKAMLSDEVQGHLTSGDLVRVVNGVDATPANANQGVHKHQEGDVLFDSTAGHDHDGSDSKKVTYTDLLSIPATFVPSAHAASHNGGADPVTPVGIGAEPTISPKNTAFNKNFGSGAGDVCQGNDSRLSDARTPTAHAASHKSAGSDAIKLDELAAPTDVTTLNATVGQHGLLPKLGGGTDNFLRADGSWAPPVFPTYQFFADQMDNPVSSEWPIQVVAPVAQDDDNNALSVRHFDDTASEGVGLIVQIPVGATNIRFDFVSRARTAPGVAKGVVPALYIREILDNAAVEAWSGATDLTTIAIPTDETFQYDNQTIALTTLSLVAGRVAQFELIRRPAAAADDLVGDWVLLLIKVSFT